MWSGPPPGRFPEVIVLYCFKCESCGREAERSLPMSQCREPQSCDCGGTMQRNRAAELRGTTPSRRILDLPATREKPLSERVRSGEFQLARHFNEIGGPKIFES